MAGTSKEILLSRRIYKNLQSLACPLLEGLYLQDDESMRDLLCTPSLLRTDILKWLCLSICPSLDKKFSTLRSTQTDEINQEILQLGHEMMLCKLGDVDLVKGLASPVRQLQFLEQLLTSAGESSSNGGEQSVAKAVVQNEEFLGELLSASHLKQLGQLLCPTCTPCTDDLKELLHRDTTWGRAAHHQSLTFKLNEDHLNEMTALLHSTETLLEELNKECKFLQVDASSPPLSPSALRIAISDLSQLMSAFSQVFNTHFRGYCNRKPPVFSPSTHTFRTVHRLLNACNQELQAVEQLLDTSSDVTEMVRQMQTERRYWGHGEKHTLSARMEELKKKYTEFLTFYQNSCM
ncbi:HAUS augmin-like complex subunit 7 [Scleropages formosus]|uniref:HAUS augmin-like complex, subunit 7 n=1 Tax=Scleropages formosus TaxID=113540 RepID=A0A8C9RQD3_SCLFO|nr:HAUS augmin-like complex subunit 7 [Scleropages formosus]